MLNESRSGAPFVMPRPTPRNRPAFDHMATADLWRATRNNDAAAARRALAHGANPNARGPKDALVQTSVVDAAVDASADEVLDVLLGAGARVVEPTHKAGALSWPNGTAVHAAARTGNMACMAVFERHRKAGPMRPFDSNQLPPLAHALRGATSSVLTRINRDERCDALVAHWLARPSALKERSGGQATFAILDASIGTRPPVFFDQLVRAGLQVDALPERPSLLVNAATRLSGVGVEAKDRDTVEAWTLEWTWRLAKAGLRWPKELKNDQRHEVARLQAAFLEASLNTESPHAPAPVRPRL